MQSKSLVHSRAPDELRVGSGREMEPELFRVAIAIFYGHLVTTGNARELPFKSNNWTWPNY
jgi:hypothetical protein